MGGRLYVRRSNGQFQRATLENTLGLSAPVCPNPDCRRLNPHAVGEAAPETCHACGTKLAPTAERNGSPDSAERPW